MRIRVDEIPDSGRLLHLHWGQEKLRQFLAQDDPFELNLLRPVNVDLEISRKMDHIHVTGSVKGSLQVACHRCLKSFPWALDEAVDVVLVEEERLPDDEEIELDADELELEIFDGVAIEVDRLIAEQIFLALPYKVLCSETCKGICPGCGVNLNDETCTCKQDENKSAFSVLRAIKARLPDS